LADAEKYESGMSEEDAFVITGQGHQYEDLCSIFSDVLDRKLHYMAVDDRELYRDYLLHDGFGESFVDDIMLPLMFEYKMDPKIAIRSDWASTLLSHDPQDFKTWLGENLHQFL